MIVVDLTERWRGDGQKKKANVKVKMKKFFGEEKKEKEKCQLH